MPLEPEARIQTALSSTASNWHGRIWRFLFVVFCFEIGVFLLVFPWLEPWNNNWMADSLPWLSHIWSNAYFRGAISGIGFLDLYISLSELFRLKRPVTQ